MARKQEKPGSSPSPQPSPEPISQKNEVVNIKYQNLNNQIKLTSQNQTIVKLSRFA